MILLITRDTVRFTEWKNLSLPGEVRPTERWHRKLLTPRHLVGLVLHTRCGVGVIACYAPLDLKKAM